MLSSLSVLRKLSVETVTWYRSHPWWPGELCLLALDELIDAVPTLTSSLRRKVMVLYFGELQFDLLLPHQTAPFEPLAPRAKVAHAQLVNKELEVIFHTRRSFWFFSSNGSFGIHLSCARGKAPSVHVLSFLENVSVFAKPRLADRDRARGETGERTRHSQKRTSRPRDFSFFWKSPLDSCWTSAPSRSRRSVRGARRYREARDRMNIRTYSGFHVPQVTPS